MFAVPSGKLVLHQPFWAAQNLYLPHWRRIWYQSQPNHKASTGGIMKALISAVQNFARDEEGITAIEYGLLAAVIAGVIAVAFANLGTVITGAFNDIGDKINNALGITPPAGGGAGG
jgi:pilus assembly protein Flp/PilA